MAVRGVVAFLVAGALAAASCTTAESEPVTIAVDDDVVAGPVVAESAEEAPEPEVEAAPWVPDPFAYNQRLARTANLGGTLEPPRGADWGNDLEWSHFDAVAAEGFTAVRLPIRFSQWAQAEAPYAIEDELIEKIDAFLDRAEELDLAIIVDLHHYDEMSVDPEGHRDRLVGIWRQIIAEFGDRNPELVSFELLNEPNRALNPELWNEIIADVVAAIREEGSEHTLIFGPGKWNNLGAIDELVVPDDDNVIVTFHYYEPFEFTHQGADWVDGSMEDIGTRWAVDLDGAGATIDADFAAAASWAQRQGVPLFLGEFGVHTVADRQDRLEWTRWTRITAEKYGISWAIWDLTGEKFGMFDENTGIWDVEALEALHAPA